MPTVITATRAELLDLTAQERRRRWGSRPWVFDPLNICSWPHGMFWNPVPACVDAERAESLATAFIFAGRKPGAEPASGNAEFFNKEAAGILKVLLHAAGLDIGLNAEHPVAELPVIARAQRVVDVAIFARPASIARRTPLRGALAEARKEALADARRNAAALAEDAGGRLGKAMDIFTYPSLGTDYSYGSGSTRSGMVDVSARVMVTYEFIL